MEVASGDKLPHASASSVTGMDIKESNLAERLKML